MSLETLANEVLHEIFEYFDAIQLFRTFHDLNHRFNTILFDYFHAYRLNFYFVVKYQSDFLSRCYISSITNQIISLRLSDKNDESPPQTDLFFSYGLSLKQFTRLRSLSLCYIDCDATMRKLIIDCQQLPSLTHLKVIKCHPGYMSSIDFSNNIWNLSKLTHCRLDSRSDFPVPTIISSSLEYFSITCECWGLRQVMNLFQYTTYLRYLHVPLNKLNNKRHQKLSSTSTITMLKLSDVHSLHGMLTILRAVPNLTHLKVDTYYINFDGHQWEELIDKNLPKLKVFHLRMRIELPGKRNSEKYVDKLLDTFRSQFWLEKHQWYVRCHRISYEIYGTILLYILPYGFVDCHSNMFTIPYKSTYPSNNDYYFYDSVKNLYDISSVEYFSIASFAHIQNLSIHLIFDKNLWKNIPIFNQLTSIIVLSTNDDAQFHLQSLLDRSPSLYSLTIRSWPASEIPIIKNTNTSVHRLDLQIDNIGQNYSYFTNEACEQLIHSSLGIQCEELLIKVKSRKSILVLINGMRHLRILQIQYSLNLPFFLGYKECEEERDIFIKWLEDHAPAKCIIERDNKNRMSGFFSKIWLYLDK